jgi:hypothetical protein
MGYYLFKTLRLEIKIVLILIIALSLNGCGIYNFTGGNVGTAKTFQVNFFQNYASDNPGSTIETRLRQHLYTGPTGFYTKSDQSRPH